MSTSERREPSPRSATAALVQFARTWDSALRIYLQDKTGPIAERVGGIRNPEGPSLVELLRKIWRRLSELAHAALDPEESRRYEYDGERFDWEDNPRQSLIRHLQALFRDAMGKAGPAPQSDAGNDPNSDERPRSEERELQLPDRTTGDKGGENETERHGPAPGWSALANASKTILIVLGKLTERMQGQGIAEKAGYRYGSLRHHFPKLQAWKYIDHTNEGYAITPVGAALIPCEHV